MLVAAMALLTLMLASVPALAGPGGRGFGKFDRHLQQADRRGNQHERVLIRTTPGWRDFARFRLELLGMEATPVDGSPDLLAVKVRRSKLDLVAILPEVEGAS